MRPNGENDLLKVDLTQGLGDQLKQVPLGHFSVEGTLASTERSEKHQSTHTQCMLNVLEFIIQIYRTAIYFARYLFTNYKYVIPRVQWAATKNCLLHQLT